MGRRAGCGTTGNCISGTWRCQDRMSQQRARTPRSEICLTNVSQGSKIQMGNIEKRSKEDLGNFNFECDHDYCGVSS